MLPVRQSCSRESGKQAQERDEASGPKHDLDLGAGSGAPDPGPARSMRGALRGSAGTQWKVAAGRLRLEAQRCACLDGVHVSQTRESAEPDAEQRAPIRILLPGPQCGS